MGSGVDARGGVSASEDAVEDRLGVCPPSFGRHCPGPDVHGVLSYGGGGLRDADGLCTEERGVHFRDSHGGSSGTAIDLSLVGDDWGWQGDASSEDDLQFDGDEQRTVGVSSAISDLPALDEVGGLGFSEQPQYQEQQNVDVTADTEGEGDDTQLRESPVRDGDEDSLQRGCNVEEEDLLTVGDADGEALPVPAIQKRKPWRKWQENLKGSVQRPPAGPFSRVDLVWARKKIGGNGKRRDTQTATIPWDRLDDFVEGEMCSRQHPCTFVELSRQCMKTDERKQTRAESAKQEIRYGQLKCYHVPVRKCYNFLFKILGFLLLSKDTQNSSLYAASSVTGVNTDQKITAGSTRLQFRRHFRIAWYRERTQQTRRRL